MSALKVKNLTVSYHSKPVLWEINFNVPQGSATAIVGPNGAGKTTLLKSILGLIPIADGEIQFFNQKLQDTLNRIAYVPQKDEVDWDFPISVYEVVLMARYSKKPIYKKITKEDKIAVQDALKKVDLWDFKDRQISELSGGQQQRTFIARALASNAEIFILDEPFAGVDAATERSIANLFKEFKKEGKTIIAVHHDLSTVPIYFDRVVFINVRLVAEGDIEDTFTPENLQKTFGGKLEVLTELLQKFKSNKKL